MGEEIGEETKEGALARLMIGKWVRMEERWMQLGCDLKRTMFNRDEMTLRDMPSNTV